MQAKSFALLAALVVAGCANNAGLTTQSITPAPEQAVASADPACRDLMAKIQVLRAEGTVGRVEQAADGKTPVVRIKRASLTKVAELNALNAEFQDKCANPALTTAAAAPAATPSTDPAETVKAAAEAEAKAATETVAAKATAPVTTSQ